MCVRPSPPSMGCMRTTRACEECLILGDSPHFRAWRDALRELMDTEWAELRGRTSYSPDKFTEAVYQEVVAGRPRLAGALAALEYFGVPDAGRRAPLYAAVKQEHLVTLIEAGEFTAFDDAIRFVLAAKAADIPIAAASSDAAVGVQAAKAGRMAALGVARLGDTERGRRSSARWKPDGE